jgi:hypothetical protein
VISYLIFFIGVIFLFCHSCVYPICAQGTPILLGLAAVHESAIGVRREKAALSSGCKTHPATAPAGSNRSSHGGNEVAEAFG